MRLHAGCITPMNHQPQFGRDQVSLTDLPGHKSPVHRSLSGSRRGDQEPTVRLGIDSEFKAATLRSRTKACSVLIFELR